MSQMFNYFTFLKNNRDINDKNQRKHIHAIKISCVLDLTDNSYTDKMEGTIHQVHGSWTPCEEGKYELYIE